jgi:C4-dicarboxylate-specific signal transduction histidine kinase
MDRNVRKPGEPAATSGEVAVEPSHVVVVDDKAVVRDFLRDVLERADHRVTTVGDGVAALEVCRRDPPQVVLTDLAMSPMTGRDIILALKDACPSAVPVVLTGYGTVERAVDLMRLGAFDVLTKPCRAEEIAATVDKALEHHKALQSNQDLRERLRVQEKLAMIGKLAAGVAHELNNPLDAALRCLRLTRERLNGDEEAGEYIDLAESGMQRMADIVQSLLTFSRNATVEQTPQPLASLVEETVASVVVALADEAPRIECVIEPRVARLPVPRGLHQVLTNLLRNAADAVNPGDAVEVHAVKDGDRIQIHVRDRGTGISADIRARIFEPFFTTKAPGRGTGLGLPLSARMVEKFGGGIRVDCPPEGGTVVTVSLPLPHATPPTPGPDAGQEAR